MKMKYPDGREDSQLPDGTKLWTDGKGHGVMTFPSGIREIYTPICKKFSRIPMHPRNPYQTPPDFKELALKFPEFRKHAKQKLTGKIEIDFKDAAAVRALSEVLLKKDFNLDVELPSNRLVPTLPLRLNYLLWIEDLLESVKSVNDYHGVHGIDIGTGACCIYPILAARKNNWHFTATEADEMNYNCSLKTLERNSLQSHVTLIKVTPDSMLNGNINTSLHYDFTMCNPPFFDSERFGPKSRTDKRPLPMCPKSGGSSSASEIAVKGGEVQFISNLIKECQDLKNCVRIFTSMVGHKSSLAPLKALLKEAEVSSWCETEFCQGRTRRWGLAWTFCESITLVNSQMSTKSNNTKPQPPLNYAITRDRWSDKGNFSVLCVMTKILEHLVSLKMEIRKVTENKSKRAVEFIARENTWSNQRRKRREGKQIVEDQPESKKKKIDEEAANQAEEQSSFFLKGLLLVEEKDSECISLQMQWIEEVIFFEMFHILFLKITFYEYLAGYLGAE
uniref:EOG090X04JL n=1 Tax=Ceriodaphnia reticulata TaxID=302197 RepID=A0A4Y7LTE7_9CRUS|nr:EOG090X04JL [Ceriodaphnia reticulata]SVE72878.1 EOG090X04JL [Ceriodaphnia reticulata]